MSLKREDGELALESGIQRLVYTNRFYAELLQRMRRVSTIDIPSMGVSYQKTGIYLYYNPFFVQQFETRELAAILEHECRHIYNEHWSREKQFGIDRTELFDKSKSGSIKQGIAEKLQVGMTANILNICEDVAINQIISNLPEKFKIYDNKGNALVDTREMVVDEPALQKYLKAGNKVNSEQDLHSNGLMIANPSLGEPLQHEACTLDNFKKMLPPNTKATPLSSFEYYYGLLQKHAGKGAGDINKNLEKMLSSLDVHEMEQATGDDIEITDSETKLDMAKQLHNEAREACKNAGTDLSDEMKQLIDSINNKPKDWRRDLRKFVARASSAYKEVSRTRRNRRQRPGEPLISGHRSESKLNLLVAMDNSGSMSDSLCAQITAEMKQMFDSGVNIYVVQCDSQINSTKQYKGETKINRTGNGGTCFNPVFQWVNDRQAEKAFGVSMDGLVYFTDGYCSESESQLIQPRVPLLWAMTDHSGQGDVSKNTRRPTTKFGDYTEVNERKK